MFAGGAPIQLGVDGQPSPKPMVRLGTHPVLWHVMRIHASFGWDDFVLCLGRGADAIKSYFLEYEEALSNDFVLTGASRDVRLLRSDMDRWRITFADTGRQAPVLQRLRAVRELVKDEDLFCASYGDVLTDAPLGGVPRRLSRAPGDRGGPGGAASGWGWSASRSRRVD